MDAMAATEFLARSTTLTSVGWIGYIVIGAIAGWIAGIVMKTKYGLLTDVVVGVVGALIGDSCSVSSSTPRAAAGGSPCSPRSWERSFCSGCCESSGARCKEPP